MKQPVVAAQLYTVRDFTQSPEGLAASMVKIRGIGYQSVEGTPFADAAPFKTMLDRAGLVLCGTHTGIEPLRADLAAVVERHRICDTKYITISSMPREDREGGEPGFRRFAREASEVGKRLADAGLVLSYHNHSFEFARFGNRTGLDIIYGESDPRYLKAQLDVYWIQHGGGDPAAWCRKLANRMEVVHLKDMEVAENGPTYAEVGNGNMNMRAVLDACAEAKVRWYIVEQDLCRRDPFESLALSYQYLSGQGLS
jgi:sugar phosphate isomerase/epimerase